MGGVPSDLSDTSSRDGGIAGWYEQRMLRDNVRRPPLRSRTKLSTEVPVENGRLLAARHLVVPGDEGRDAVMGKVRCTSAPTHTKSTSCSMLRAT